MKPIAKWFASAFGIGLGGAAGISLSGVAGAALVEYREYHRKDITPKVAESLYTSFVAHRIWDNMGKPSEACVQTRPNGENYAWVIAEKSGTARQVSNAKAEGRRIQLVED